MTLKKKVRMEVGTEVPPELTVIKSRLINQNFTKQNKQKKFCYDTHYNTSLNKWTVFSLFLCAADNVKVTPDGALLTIVSAQAVNHGAYRCVASNPFGITHTIVSLMVKGKIDMFSISSP